MSGNYCLSSVLEGLQCIRLIGEVGGDIDVLLYVGGTIGLLLFWEVI